MTHFRQEFYEAAGNPRAILIFTVFFQQFVDHTHYALSFAVIGAAFLVLELVAIGIYALIGARLRFLIVTPTGFVWLNWSSRSLMIGFGTWLELLRRSA